MSADDEQTVDAAAAALARARETSDWLSEQFVKRDEHSGFDGDPGYTQLRGGGYFDTDVAQRDKGWTDAERELAEQRLLDLAENGPRADYYRTLPARERPPGFGDVKVYERPRPTAPWPTHASVPAGKVAKLASEMGLVAEALNYEQRLFDDDRRPEVIAALEKELERLQRG
jgi:hypothetical protein